MAAPLVVPKLDNSLGAAFLGNVVAAVFYGITNIQTYIYFKRDFGDGIYFKLMIVGLWALDGLHLAFITHSMYYYMVTSFSNFLAITVPTWSILAHVLVTSISDLIVRGVFAKRVWRLSGGNWYLTTAIAATTVFVFGGGMAYGIKAFSIHTYHDLDQIAWLMYATLASGVVADALIAVSLCILLNRNRTGFKKTDSVVSLLMMYTINTGLLTSLCAISTFVTYAVMPNNFIFIALYFILSKLYLNSLLTTLNARTTLRENLSTEVSIPMSHTGRTSRARRTRDGDYEAQVSRADRVGSLAVNVETTTDTKIDPEPADWEAIRTSKTKQTSFAVAL
ncbi:hypothetical protein JAAARDRAFT_196997 [Jaapia argillacea MUCL 33604]|uniref:DUF6534 domain-containing protein n=1 Tax=Jaapia argillacea MUCL 33604 TaxID=933084 RepID=A0A067PU77_9AGAM|nr:hypothetical protein JAAARDRAFT_196997 [Jaapia argillacea MUCL 33604]